MSFLTRAAACLLFIFALLPHDANGAVPPPPEAPGNYVVDLADVIGPDSEKDIAGLLRELEDKTGAQVIVLTEETLEGEPIETFSISLVEKWKLGQKGKDNGVLIVVATKDRKYRFEVGYGLEGVLPDSFVGTVGRERLVPYFRKGDYSTGIHLAAIDVAKTIAQSQGVALEGGKGPKRSLSKKAAGFAPVIVIIIVIILLSLRSITGHGVRRHRGGPGGVVFWPDTHGGGFGRGGFGGGGFGGFGGGGGGGFGGGGASGGW